MSSRSYSYFTTLLYIVLMKFLLNVICKGGWEFVQYKFSIVFHTPHVTSVVVVVVVVVTLFPTKMHENTHMYDTFTVVSTQNVRMYFVSGCQKKLRLIELAVATCYLQFCRATARPGLEEMTHWHPGGRFKESFSSNGFHNIYSIILSRIISRYVSFHQMSF